MRRALTWLGTVVGGVLVVVLIALGAAYAVSGRQLARVYPVPKERPLAVPTDSATIARGRHLASAVTPCTLCHGADLGGAVYADAGAMGFFAGPNLTRGRRGAQLTDADWERSVRHGVHRDGTSLIAMPSEEFTHLTDEDLGAIVAAARAAPPVPRNLPPTHFRVLGRVLLAAHKLPLLVAPKTPRVPHTATVLRGPTAEYGRYIADVSGCHGCHGYGLSGGRVGGPPGLPPASNLTPTGIGRWTETDFVRAIREGRRPDGSTLNPFMPWTVFGNMTDEELHALWLYLRSVPPREFGHK